MKNLLMNTARVPLHLVPKPTTNVFAKGTEAQPKSPNLLGLRQRYLEAAKRK